MSHFLFYSPAVLAQSCTRANILINTQLIGENLRITAVQFPVLIIIPKVMLHISLKPKCCHHW